MGISVVDLDVYLGKKQILNKLSLQVENGEFFSLLGPSGCGKSTFLKTIAGLIEQTGGSVIMDDVSLDRFPPHKRDIVLVFQDLRLFPHLTAVENVAFPLKMAGMGKKERITKAASMLNMVQLIDFEHRKISQMSGGQQQRVALARALIARPKVLLLDEPFSSLDENLRGDMRDLLRQLHERFQTTTILVTHDHEEALMLSDRIAVMLNGEIVQCDTPVKIYNHPKTLQTAAYFCDGNTIKGQVRDAVFYSDILVSPAETEDGGYIAMLRPNIMKPDRHRKDFQVLHREYRGDHWRLKVEKNGVCLSCRVDESDIYQLGDMIGLTFDCEKILYYKEGD